MEEKYIHTAAGKKHTVAEFHHRKAPKIEHVYPMTCRREYSEKNREAIEDDEEDVDGDYQLDEAGKNFFR